MKCIAIWQQEYDVCWIMGIIEADKLDTYLNQYKFVIAAKFADKNCVIDPAKIEINIRNSGDNTSSVDFILPTIAEVEYPKTYVCETSFYITHCELNSLLENNQKILVGEFIKQAAELSNKKKQS